LINNRLIDIYGYYKNSAKRKNELVATAAASIRQQRIEQEVNELGAEMDRSIEHGRILI